ncbi:TPA: GAF domain-containing protein [Salmonella enterica subsp. enterica serovar Typhimurium]
MGGILSPRRRYAGVGAVSGANRLCADSGWSRVCGAAVAQNKVQRIDDVHAFDGHIACDAASNAEIVLPVTVGERIIGVLDIDSTAFGRFTEEDEHGLRTLVAQLETVLATTDYKKFFASVAG